MQTITVVTTHVVKSPEIFESRDFIRDICAFRHAVFLATGCFGVQVLKDALEPCEKFYFISHWKSIDALMPHMNAKYSRRMSLFKKKYLSFMDVTMTYDFFPKMESLDEEEKNAEINRKSIRILTSQYKEGFPLDMHLSHDDINLPKELLNEVN